MKIRKLYGRDPHEVDWEIEYAAIRAEVLETLTKEIEVAQSSDSSLRKRKNTYSLSLQERRLANCWQLQATLLYTTILTSWLERLSTVE